MKPTNSMKKDIDAEKIPVSETAKDINGALNDGEDFELLFTLQPDQYEKLKAEWDMPLQITEIGTITEKKQMKIKMPDGNIEILEPSGYDHLKE